MKKLIFNKSKNKASKQIVSSVMNKLRSNPNAAIDKEKVIGILLLTDFLISKLADKPPTFFISNYNKIASITSTLRPSLIDHVRNEVSV